MKFGFIRRLGPMSSPRASAAAENGLFPRSGRIGGIVGFPSHTADNPRSHTTGLAWAAVLRGILNEGSVSFIVLFEGRSG